MCHRTCIDERLKTDFVTKATRPRLEEHTFKFYNKKQIKYIAMSTKCATPYAKLFAVYLEDSRYEKSERNLCSQLQRTHCKDVKALQQ